MGSDVDVVNGPAPRESRGTGPNIVLRCGWLTPDDGIHRFSGHRLERVDLARSNL